jgi:hypothetical protein
MVAVELLDFVLAGVEVLEFVLAVVLPVLV